MSLIFVWIHTYLYMLISSCFPNITAVFDEYHKYKCVRIFIKFVVIIEFVSVKSDWFDMVKVAIINTRRNFNFFKCYETVYVGEIFVQL